jgi:hypothetical protein
MTIDAAELTDCGTPTRSRYCREHNVRDCATCIKTAGACDWGACHEPAAVRGRCLLASTGEVAETRPLCVRHMVTWSQRTGGGRWSFESESL